MPFLRSVVAVGFPLPSLLLFFGLADMMPLLWSFECPELVPRKTVNRQARNIRTSIKTPFSASLAGLSDRTFGQPLDVALRDSVGPPRSYV